MQFSDRGPHSLSKIQPVLQVQIHLMHHNLGIGFGTETQARSALFIAQGLVVLDNSVADECQGAVTDMRVRVGLGDPTVRRPARMGNSGRAFERLLPQRLLEFTNFANGSSPLQSTARADHHHPGRIVAAVFEAAQAFEQKTTCFRCSYCSDNPAHNVYLPF